MTNALLMDSGYTVSRCVSLEQSIAESADDHYQSLLESTHGWHDDQADPWPWLGYFVSILDGAYRTFASRAVSDRGDGSEQDRVREHVVNHAPDPFRMADIRTALPGVSDQTIRLVLDKLRKEGAVVADGVGRSTLWHRTGRP